MLPTSSLTEQYTKILIPSKEAQARLERRSGGPPTEEDRISNGRREVLKDAKERAEWERWESSRRKEIEDAEEADRIAFAEIDWQDFVVVSTVEFTEGDEAGLVELPPPMSISEVENMTLAQKKMAAMIMEGREDEVAENERERERGEEAEMDMDDDEEEAPEADQQAKLEQERQRVVQAAATDSSAPMKIRKDYVPKGEFLRLGVFPSTNTTNLDFPLSQPSDQRKRLKPIQLSAISKCLSKSLPSTFVSSCSTLGGRRRSVKARPIVRQPTCSLEVRLLRFSSFLDLKLTLHFCYAQEPMLPRRCVLSLLIVPTSSAPGATRRPRNGKRRRSPSPRLARWAFGMDIRLPRTPLPTGIRLAPTLTSKSRRFIVPRVFSGALRSPISLAYS